MASKRRLTEYEKKRDFARTPEPGPQRRDGGGKARAPGFVVHRHDATRLHYDLRIEIDGALRSWAIPKGFTYDREEKRLAVQTEDHPLAYEDFEGTIPKGEYGAGPMAIFDKGTYRLARGTDPGVECATGELKILLYGRRLRGEWHLVQTKADKGKAWLLFKSKDRYEGGELDVLLRMGVGAATAWRDGEVPATMECGGERAPFSASAWLYEMAFAGLRVCATTNAGAVSIHAGGRDLAPAIPNLERALGNVRATRAVLDGVLVALDANQRPDPQALTRALEGDDASRLVLYAFDLLAYDDLDVRPLPLVDRKALLRAALPESTQLLYVDHVVGEGERLCAAVSAAGLPAVIAKKGDAPYSAGPSPEWQRIPLVPDAGARDVAVAAALDARPKRRARTARVKLSNLDKVFWPDDGTTKGQLLDYYDAVAETLLPYLQDRPIHMDRHPDGVGGKSFYQREAPEHLPEWFPTVPIASESKGRPIRHMLCQDRDCLLCLANLGTIDLHPWLSRHQTPDSPDWAVLDIDAKTSPFPHVLRIARAARKVLSSIGVTACVKTSGKTGMHVHIPLKAGYTYDHSRMFCEGIARVILRDHKDIASIERTPAKRGGRIYLDFLQNRRGQTVVPPYSARPVAGATVSAPLTWDELNSDLHPSQFTIHNMPRRILEMGDLFRPTLSEPQDLLPAIERLQGLLGG